MTYPNIHLARFIQRPNRFIAECRLEDSEEPIIAHVKNTGRCKELLLPNAEVALSYQPSSKRKTDYDLIAVKKGNQWINIDSQVPNALAAQALLDGTICLPELSGEIVSVKREKRYANSQFDLLIQTDNERLAFVEVKGMTLENNQIGAFPDAPTLRGLKHVNELIAAQSDGYQCYVLFVIQFEQVKKATIHQEMQPELAQAIQRAQAHGVQVIAYNCQVTPATISIDKPVPFDVSYDFESPNKER
ncbi:DNA/RNA nuclease SfsA [Enterococcus sp. LJL99]